MSDDGRQGLGAGEGGHMSNSSREPSPAVSALAGFDPARGCELCRDPGGEPWFPMYGVAPHECFWRKGPQFTIGQSTLVPFGPDDCFVPELETGETWADFLYPAATGIYYCPNCNRAEYEAAWQRLVARVGSPPADVGACHHG